MKKSQYLKARRRQRGAGQRERNLVPHKRVPLQEAVDRAMALHGMPEDAPVSEVVAALSGVTTIGIARTVGRELTAQRG